MVDIDEAQRSKLCNHCLTFFKTTFFTEAVADSDTGGTATITLDKSRDDLDRAATECEICSLLLQDVHTYDGNIMRFAMEYILGDQPHDIISARLLYQAPAEEVAGLTTSYNITIATYNVHALPDDAAAGYIRARPVETNVASPESFDVALSWLQNCSKNHDGCVNTGDQGMPTRCLDISNLQNIHLRLTKSQQKPYLALSYCWGPKQYPNLVTTKSSLTEMMKNIQLSKFPPTLRDGILVAHKLHIDYIWIDALCIIQDDENDKENEIPQIRRIFQHAFCTIIAASAAHCHAGFLHQRVPLPVSTLKVPFPGPYSSEGTMILNKTDPEKYSLYDPLEDPINERAWTLEERLLSTRRLVYSKRHVRWLCETTELVNGGHVDDRKWPAARGQDQMECLPAHLSPRSVAAKRQPDTPNSRQVWLSWLRIVREYNLRELTESKDKLRAIAGIAELYQLKTNDRYCAGLWYSYLAEELLWKISHPRATFTSLLNEERYGANSTSYPLRTLFPRPAYRAPTWSWASVDGTAANHRALTGAPFVADVFQVIDCSIVSKSRLSSLTAVVSGMLTVRGRMKMVLFDIASQMLYESDEAFRKAESFANAHLDTLDVLDDDVTTPPRPVYCLEITSRIRSGFSGNQQGILLVPEAEENTYSRIGTFGTDDLHVAWFDGITPETIKIR